MWKLGDRAARWGKGAASPELGFGPLRRGVSSLLLASLSGFVSLVLGVSENCKREPMPATGMTVLE